MKKRLCILLVVALILGSTATLFAEGQSETPTNEVPTNELTVNSMRTVAAWKEVMETLVARFEELNPGIKVTLNTTNTEEFKTSVRLWLASDNPPDVFTWFAGNRAMYFVDKGLIMDITDVWKDADLYNQFPKAFQSISFKDDRAYFLPECYYGWVITYRKSIFAKYNLKPPKTWEELLTVCATLKSNGITPFAIGTKGPWTAAGWFDYLNMRINGPDFHRGLMFGKEKYTDPRLLKVFEVWGELVAKGYYTKNAASYSWQEAVPFLARGESAMYFLGQFLLDAVPEDIKSDVDFFQFPIIDPKVPIGEDAPTDGYMISKKAKNVANAKKFLKFVASPEAQRITAEKLGRIMTNKAIPLDLYPPLTQKSIKMMREDVDALNQFYDRDTLPEIAAKGMDAMMEWWYNPDNIKQILEQLEKDRVRIFAEQEK